MSTLGRARDEDMMFPSGTFDGRDDEERELTEVVEYHARLWDASEAARAIEINCGGRVDVRKAADGYGWEVVR